MSSTAKRVIRAVLLLAICHSGASRQSIPSQPLQDTNTTACRLEVDSDSVAAFAEVMETNAEVDMVKMRLDWRGGGLTFHSNKYCDMNNWVFTSRDHVLLSLPFDADILSLGTLTRNVYSITVELTARPSGCDERLDDTEKIALIAKTLLENVTYEYSENLLCFLTVETMQSEKAPAVNTLKFQCCSDQDLNCDLDVQQYEAVNTILIILTLMGAISAYFAPILITYLPQQAVQDDQGEFGTRERLMYLDGEVPKGIGYRVRKWYVSFPSRCKRIILFLFILPGCDVACSLLYYCLKNEEMALRFKNDILMATSLNMNERRTLISVIVCRKLCSETE